MSQAGKRNKVSLRNDLLIALCKEKIKGYRNESAAARDAGLIQPTFNSFLKGKYQPRLETVMLIIGWLQIDPGIAFEVDRGKS